MKLSFKTQLEDWVFLCRLPDIKITWINPCSIIETSPLICRANQKTGFYMIGTSVMKELKAIKASSMSQIFCRSSHPKAFYKQVVLEICSKFTGEHSCWRAISIKLLCKATLLKSHFGGMGVLLLICCIFSEYPFLRTPLDDCLKFWEIHKKASMMEFNFSKLVDYNWNFTKIQLYRRSFPKNLSSFYNTYL